MVSVLEVVGFVDLPRLKTEVSIVLSTADIEKLFGGSETRKAAIPICIHVVFRTRFE